MLGMGSGRHWEDSDMKEFCLSVGLQVKEVFQFHVITHHSEFKLLEFCGILKFVKKIVNFKIRILKLCAKVYSW